MKIAVLGAGVSGLSVARMLKEKGYSVVVYEKNSTVGGLARTRFTNGYLYDPHGGHIFNSKNPDVVDWVFSVLNKEKWKYSVRNAKIFFNGKFVSYPFELSLRELDVEDAINCIYDFMLSKEGKEPTNFRDWLVWNFGKSIADYYMIPYNEKIWAYPLEDMETQWIQGKMPLPEKKEMLRNTLLKDPSERKMVHSTFYYPFHGGIQSLMDAIAEGLDIHCDAPVEKIEHSDNKWYINGEGSFDLVISTIPLPILPNVMNLPAQVVNHISNLKYNSLTTVLFDCPQTDISWLYIPSHDYRAHRVGYQSALTPFATPVQDRGCAALEIIGKKFDVTNLDQESNILPEELGYKATIDSEFTEYAYVIHDMKYRESINGVLGYFAKEPSFRLLGRWGTWNYKNMDLCIFDAMKLVADIQEKVERK